MGLQNKLTIAVFSFMFCATVYSNELANAALDRTNDFVRYNPKYVQLDYPNGDVPANTGVCTDVVIRSFRALNFDLQHAVHEDMKLNFDLYPSKRIWGLSKPDTNIDHRRVPNLQTFFERHGESYPVSDKKDNFLPGDIVTWILPGNKPHIGIVSTKKSLITKTPLIVHNIGFGPQLENMLFDYKITGHYRFMPESASD